jgi:hypothetical protein
MKFGKDFLFNNFPALELLESRIIGNVENLRLKNICLSHIVYIASAMCVKFSTGNVDLLKAILKAQSSLIFSIFCIVVSRCLKLCSEKRHLGCSL